MQIKVVSVLGKGRAPSRRIPDSGCSPHLGEQLLLSVLRILRATQDYIRARREDAKSLHSNMPGDAQDE